MNMLLTSEEHCIGRLVDDTRFQILSPAVSAQHCKIYRKKVVSEDMEHSANSCTAVFLKDSRLNIICGTFLMQLDTGVYCLILVLCSTNGTYLNWEKLNKGSPEVRLRHGDIISIAFAPHHGRVSIFIKFLLALLHMCIILDQKMINNFSLIGLHWSSPFRFVYSNP